MYTRRHFRRTYYSGKDKLLDRSKVVQICSWEITNFVIFFCINARDPKIVIYDILLEIIPTGPRAAPNADTSGLLYKSLTNVFIC